MTTKTIHWGIIGVGAVCEKKSGPAFYNLPHSRLMAVMRRDAAQAQDFAQRHQVAEWFTDADEILEHPQIDAVYIATPPVHHKNYAIAALKAGKNVYLEKPATLNAKECDDIITAAERTGKKIGVAHYRRKLPIFLKIAELIHSGAIGEVLTLRIDFLRSASPSLISNAKAYWRVNPRISGGGFFHDLAPHQLDLLLHWFGPVTEAQGFALNQRQFYNADDCVQGNAKFASGAILQGRWHFGVAEAQQQDVGEIFGTHGSIRFNFFGEPRIELENNAVQQTFLFEHPPTLQQPLIEQVNNYFRKDSLAENPCSIIEAKAVMELIDKFVGRTD
jgi:1,5-anhydro-D-fructose reductase (1,5-anhydro-D-mannitol-forming)